MAWAKVLNQRKFWKRWRTLQALRDFDVASNGRAIASRPSRSHVCKTRRISPHYSTEVLHGKPFLKNKEAVMKRKRKFWLDLPAGALLGLLAAITVASGPAAAQQQQRPNILFIMGDDIGWMQPSIYHQGLMVGETPSIDRIGEEGAKFIDYVAMQSCTAGRNAFFTGMYPLRTGLIPPQLPGSPSYLRPGTPALAKFLLDLGYTTGEFGKNHL